MYLLKFILGTGAEKLWKCLFCAHKRILGYLGRGADCLHVWHYLYRLFALIQQVRQLLFGIGYLDWSGGWRHLTLSLFSYKVAALCVSKVSKSNRQSSKFWKRISNWESLNSHQKLIWTAKTHDQFTESTLKGKYVALSFYLIWSQFVFPSSFRYPIPFLFCYSSKNNKIIHMDERIIPKSRSENLLTLCHFLTLFTWALKVLCCIFSEFRPMSLI